ncbi:MAG TPA: hypothetical protein VM012_03700, partial [Flavitalea sp.]|nr:hypothetical protein [Flavitalea sp.]
MAQNQDKTADSDTQSLKYEEIHFVDSTLRVWNYSLFSPDDISNFKQGTHYSLYRLFGAHLRNVLGTSGYYFAVWAPNATYISVIGEFNNWDKESHPLFVRLDHSGIWEGFIPNLLPGASYKYHIHGYKGVKLDK